MNVLMHRCPPAAARFDATHEQGLRAEAAGQAGGMRVFCFFYPIFISPFGEFPKMQFRKLELEKVRWLIH